MSEPQHFLAAWGAGCLLTAFAIGLGDGIGWWDKDQLPLPLPYAILFWPVALLIGAVITVVGLSGVVGGIIGKWLGGRGE